MKYVERVLLADENIIFWAVFIGLFIGPELF